jgi:hypothetical protein
MKDIFRPIHAAMQFRHAAKTSFHPLLQQMAETNWTSAKRHSHPDGLVF